MTHRHTTVNYFVQTLSQGASLTQETGANFVTGAGNTQTHQTAVTTSVPGGIFVTGENFQTPPTAPGTLVTGGGSLLRPATLQIANNEIINTTEANHDALSPSSPFGPAPSNSQVTNLLATLQQQYASANTNVHQPSLPPVPPKIREKIIKGDFIDFTTLLTKVMFSSRTESSFTFQLPDSGGELSLHPSTKPKRITSFSNWMEAWNVYLAVCINHTPSRAPSLVAYQHIIASASLQHPLES